MADHRVRRAPRTALAALALVALLSACSQREEILPGEREPVRADEAAAEAVVPRAVPIRLPRARALDDWSHLNGNAAHLAPHAVLDGELERLWSVDIGRGAGRRVRLVSAPVVQDNVIYTLDAGATVSAVAANGALLWQSALAPLNEKPTEGFGGGIAVESGRLVVTTGFGEVLRLDPATGSVLWRTELGGAVRAGPALAGDRAIVVARGDLAYGVDLGTGVVDWRVQGTGLGAGVLGGAAPAVRGPLAVLPFQSGEIRGVLVRNGLTVWTAAVTGGRRGLARATISDVSGDPVIDFDIVYAANQAGRIVALDRRSGARLWTHQDGAFGPALPVGGSVFLMSDIAELVRLSAGDGAVIWKAPLPRFIEGKPNKGVIPHYGPVLAGGRLVVVSGDRKIRLFDPASGALVGQVALPAGASAAPALAGGRLYVVDRDGTLHAFQ